MGSVALATSYLSDDGYDVIAAPEFGTGEDGASLMQVFLFTTFKGAQVATDTDIHKTAGYISASIRASQCCETMVAEELDSVGMAIRSLALVRSFVEEEGLDLCFEPRFPDF